MSGSAKITFFQDDNINYASKESEWRNKFHCFILDFNMLSWAENSVQSIGKSDVAMTKQQHRKIPITNLKKSTYYPTKLLRFGN